MGKRQESAKLTREKIVQAAKDLHKEKGLSNVSVDEITEKAEVSKGSFYVYFKRKVDVASEIAFQNFDELKQSLENFSGNNVEKVGRFLSQSVQFIEEQGLTICQEWMKGAVCPIGCDDSGMFKFNFDRDFILKILCDAKKSGEISENAMPENLADILMAEYYGDVCLWALTNGNFPMVKRMEEFVSNLDKILIQYK